MLLDPENPSLNSRGGKKLFTERNRDERWRNSAPSGRGILSRDDGRGVFFQRTSPITGMEEARAG